MSEVKERLSAEIIRSYRTDGFVKLSALLSPEDLELLRAVVAQDTEGASQLIGQRGDETGSYAYQQSDNYRRMWSNAIDLRLNHPELNPVVENLAETARQLLGEDDVRILWDKTFAKPPSSVGTRQTVWHQDYPFIPVDRRGLLTIWIAVWDVSEEAGALRFVPGSHRLGPIGRVNLVEEEYELDALLRAEDLELVGAPRTVPLTAGDATVHDGLTIHGAGENRTAEPRVGWSLVFVPGQTLWTGATHPHANLDALGMKPTQPFDHPQFRVGSSPT